MDDGFSRLFKYANDFYSKRMGLVVIFSLPFVFAFLIPALVPAPTYVALGGVFLRTGSIPELSLLDILITAVAYGLSVFVIADTIVNVNIVVRSKRTLTDIQQDVTEGLGTYAMRIFYIYTLMLLLLFIAQLVLYEIPFQSILYPLFSFVLSFLLFFVPTAVVIDNSDTPTAIRRSVSMALRKPEMILIWAVLLLLITSIVTFFAQLVFSHPFSGYFVLLVNSLIVLPYMIVLQTQMYMEKYPLAR